MFVSTTTLAGRTTAEQRLKGLARGVFFAPLDYKSIVRRVLRRLRPTAVVVMETEIWPHLYREAKRAGSSLLVVNGRISDRALPRYRRFRGLFRHVLRLPDRILVQSGQDVQRYEEIGAPVERVDFTGNLKYDFRPPEALRPELAAFLGAAAPGPVWVAASTMPPAEAQDADEDDVVIDAFKKHFPAGLLVLAPRRPECFEVVAEKLRRAGVDFVRRSDLHGSGRVLLLDSMGELAAVFEHASVVFMGGTLASRGGHNILEPAYFGKPVIVGPHMENFAEIEREFSAARALVKISDSRALGDAVEALLQDHIRARQIGERARELALAKRGVVDRVAAAVLEAAGRGVCRPMRNLAARIALRPIACLWAAGHHVNLKRRQASARRLDTRVVSVGGLTMGGAGKSPIVAHLAARLADAGRNPAILTRGYGRRASHEIVIVPRGATEPVERTGDEAQMLIRRAKAHVGIGANRYDAGRRMEAELRPDVFLLDDGFQHVALQRDVDIVLVDALDPLGDGLFPLGRRREPLEALARATAVVITRVQQGIDPAGIEALIRRYNARAPVFRSRIVAAPWPEPRRRVGAFCGIGSPRSFWRTLAGLNLDVVYRRAFRDHYAYAPADVRAVAAAARAAGAEVLATTEKDMMNLPPDAGKLAAPLEIRCVRIEIEIENEGELLRHLL